MTPGDASPRVSKALLLAGALSAILNLADSVRTRGPLRAVTLFALSTGLPAFGEALVTGPFGLLRHRTKPRVKGVPVAILLLWYNVICGSYAATERTLARSPLGTNQQREALPLATAAVATSLDLMMDPFGLDSGLWEWNVDGAYAPEIRGTNGKSGVPVLNYWGWLVVVVGVVLAYTRLFPENGRGSRLPILLLLPQYLAAAGWTIKRRRPVYLIYSSLFPLVSYLGSKKD
ncbi:MAG: carotenoid biosynthesis protein [Rubrobacteraceae bacterium]